MLGVVVVDVTDEYDASFDEDWDRMRLERGGFDSGDSDSGDDDSGSDYGG